MKYFKVQKGYNADDYISIDETELEMAMRAQISGKVGIFKEGTVSGNHIISITPNWNKVMGWNRDYTLGSEDYAEIGKGRMREYQDHLMFTEKNVQRQLQGLPPLEKIEANNSSNLTKGIADKMRIS